MIKYKIALILLSIIALSANAQNITISENGTYNSSSGNAILDIKSLQYNKGIMIPSVDSTQRLSMATSVNDSGLIVYDITTKSFWYWDSNQWKEISDKQILFLSGHTLQISNGNSVMLPDNQILNLNGHTLSISNGNSITLPQDTNWYLWNVDYFSSNDPLGWSGAGMTNCAGVWLLGGYNECGAGCVLSKTFTALPPHSKVMVEIQWWSIDSWDESDEIGLDSVSVYIDNHFAAKAVAQTLNLKLSDGSSNYHRSTNSSPCGAQGWTDEGPLFIKAEIPHTASNLTIDIKSQVNQAADDESLAIQAVYIWLKP